MHCPEYTKLSEALEGRRKAYAYIRLNETRVNMSKRHYEELVKEAHTAMTTAMKDLGWHAMKCSACKGS
jgi:hypothetical protein